MAEIKFNLKGINELMTSAPVQAEIDRVGRQVAGRAGAGFGYSQGQGRHPWVARGYVETQAPAAARRNARENTLLRALGGGP